MRTEVTYRATDLTLLIRTEVNYRVWCETGADNDRENMKPQEGKHETRINKTCGFLGAALPQ